MEVKFLKERGKRMWFRFFFLRERFDLPGLPWVKQNQLLFSAVHSPKRRQTPKWCRVITLKNCAGIFWAITVTITYNDRKCRLWKPIFIITSKCSFLTTNSFLTFETEYNLNNNFKQLTLWSKFAWYIASRQQERSHVKPKQTRNWLNHVLPGLLNLVQIKANKTQKFLKIWILSSNISNSSKHNLKYYTGLVFNNLINWFSK